MAESRVQAEKCSKCGVVTRDEAEYCFNCGSKVATTIEVLVETEVADDTDNTTDVFRPRETSADAIPIPDIPIEPIETAVEKAPEESKPMRTAASLRRDRNRVAAKPKEVVWVQHDGPGKAFLVSSVIVVVVTAIILIAAMYLK